MSALSPSAKLFAALGAGLAAAFLPSVSRGAPVPVVNPSFEVPAISAPIATYAAGSSALTGWTIASGDVDQVGTSWQQVSGNQSLDVSGSGPGSIFQDVATTPGQTLTLMFDLAGNPGGGPAVKQLQVAWDGKTVGTISFDVTGKSFAAMGWATQTLSLPAATTSTTRLQFTSLTAGQFGPVIDNITLNSSAVSAVPLPAAAMVAPPTLLLAGLLSRRLRRR